MNNHILKFKAVDKHNFDDIASGRKTIETRAGSPAYTKVATGDTLTIMCGKEKLVRTVKKVHAFRTIGALLKALPLKKIMPDVTTEKEARARWNSYTGYKERIKQYGLIAWELK
jgi:ASC-1-like (ASCH) protein